MTTAFIKILSALINLILVAFNIYVFITSFEIILGTITPNDFFALLLSLFGLGLSFMGTVIGALTLEKLFIGDEEWKRLMRIQAGIVSLVFVFALTFFFYSLHILFSVDF
jgi:hypothetical protein